MQRARPGQRGGQNGDTPNPVSDTTRLADSQTYSELLMLEGRRAVSLKGYTYQVRWECAGQRG